ncbi:unnamed protein product [Orchesella dallaii]|uniref:Lipase domain-containing protein n=1 Tax=Orchesella dallaii TaxID=48710 RepID=A0ABP1QNH8_9HEXA
MLYVQNTVTLLILWLFANSAYANDEFAGPILNPTDVTFLLYSQDNSYTEVTPEFVESSLVEAGAKTYFVIDGLYSNRTTLMAQTVKDDLITLPNCNVIMVDWAPLSGYLAFRPSMNDLELRALYNNVTTYVPAIAREVVNLIESLKIKNIPLSQVHVIGFSLGAQIGAVVGSEITKKDNEKLGRITGLDPASFNYQEENVTAANRLDVTDATFIDIYHTNRLCDHRFSWKIWNLAFKKDIKACPCKVEAPEDESICTNLRNSSCTSPVRIGMFISTTIAGNFFVGFKNTTGPQGVA